MTKENLKVGDKCPECEGVLSELNDPNAVVYLCSVCKEMFEPGHHRVTRAADCRLYRVNLVYSYSYYAHNTSEERAIQSMIEFVNGNDEITSSSKPKSTAVLVTMDMLTPNKHKNYIPIRWHVENQYDDEDDICERNCAELVRQHYSNCEVKQEASCGGIALHSIV